MLTVSTFVPDKNISWSFRNQIVSPELLYIISSYCNCYSVSIIHWFSKLDRDISKIYHTQKNDSSHLRHKGEQNCVVFANLLMYIAFELPVEFIHFTTGNSNAIYSNKNKKKMLFTVFIKSTYYCYYVSYLGEKKTMTLKKIETINSSLIRRC